MKKLANFIKIFFCCLGAIVGLFVIVIALHLASKPTLIVTTQKMPLIEQNTFSYINDTIMSSINNRKNDLIIEIIILEESKNLPQKQKDKINLLKNELFSLNIIEKYFLDKGFKPAIFELKLSNKEIIYSYSKARNFIYEYRVNSETSPLGELPKTVGFVKNSLKDKNLSGREIAELINTSLNKSNQLLQFNEYQ